MNAAREKIKAANRERFARLEQKSKKESAFKKAVTGIRQHTKNAQVKYLQTVERLRMQQLEAVTKDDDYALNATKGGKKTSAGDVREVSHAPTQEQVEQHRTDVARKQKEKITNHVFMEYCRRQVIQKDNCLTIPFTCLLWVMFMLVIISHSNIAAVYLTRTGVLEDVERIEIVRSQNETAQPLDIYKLATRDDLHLWITDGFLPRINGSAIKVYNRLGGSVVLSQSRAKKTSCGVDDGLKAFYGNAPCFPVDQPLSDNFGLLGPEFIHRYGLSSEAAEEFRYYAFLNFWDENNPSLLSQPNTALAETVRQQQSSYYRTLMQREWIDTASIDLQLRFFAYNPETKVYINAKLEFVFHRGGWIEKKLDIHAETSDLYEDGMAIIYDIIWLILVGILMFVEVQQMKLVQGSMDLMAMKAWNWAYWEYLREYWQDIWNLIDWLSVGLGFGFVFEIMALQSLLSDLVQMFKNIGPSAITTAAGTGQFGSVGRGLSDYYQSNLEILKLLDDINDKRKTVQLLGFIYSMLIILRFFKGFRGQPRIAIMGLSLVSAMYDMLHFLIIFFLVYVNYSIGGWILFGPQLEEWNTLLRSIGVTLKVIFGDFDFDRIYATSPVIAVLWFYSYIVICLFLVLNLLTALVYDKYMGVMHSTNYRGAKTMWEQVKSIVADTLMSQSQDVDRATGKPRTIDYEAIYETMKEYVDRDEVIAENQKIDEENVEFIKNGEEPIDPDLKAIRLKLARARSTKNDSEWAITSIEQVFEGHFANSAITRDFLVEKCGTDVHQAIYLISKCIQESLDDAKTLEPEQFLAYTMRFEFQDLQEQLDDLRHMVFTLQDLTVNRQDRLIEMSDLVRENIENIEPYLDEEWEFVPTGYQDRSTYRHVYEDRVQDTKPLNYRFMDQGQKDRIDEDRNHRKGNTNPFGDQSQGAEGSQEAQPMPLENGNVDAAVAEIEATVDAAVGGSQ
ncbi:unnamed protein product [Amoebophrya sp. A25]|nr:unnamed protein product [Amoebophrya sp. A25]|eukprot:GSA25T00011542001.1